jgi:phage terminase large subunit-like protein
MVVVKEIHPVTKYALEVVNGQRVVGHSEYLACQRHLDDLKRQGTKDFPWVFSEEKANKVYDFFTYLRHVKGPLAGKPIILEDFEKYDVGSIFGWVHKDTGFRRFLKAYLQEARKNGKSTIASGIELYLMIGDGEESPEVYTAAVDRNQAQIIFKDAKRMAEKSPDIRSRLDIHKYAISHKVRGGELKAFSRDTQNKDGFNPSGAFLDEFHAHKTTEIYDVIWSAWGQRAQGLFSITTTAGFNAGKSPCWNEYAYCKKILSGEIVNERYFVMIRELDPDDDEHDSKNWIKANPLKGLTPEGVQFLQELHDEVFSSQNPSKIRNFRIKHLDSWVYGNEDSYMGEIMAKWDNLAVRQEGTPDEKRAAFADLTRGMLCNIGFDLSRSIDLTADGFVFALPDGRVAICATGFMPEEALDQHEKTDKVNYKDFEIDGWLKKTEGAVTDYSEIEIHMKDMELDNDWEISEVDYDPYNATHFATELMKEEYTCVVVRQGYQTLSEPTKLFRELVAGGKLVHDGSPLLKFCVGNAHTKPDRNANIILAKPTEGSTERIDLLAAIINALSGLPRLKDAVSSDSTSEILDDEWGM